MAVAARRRHHEEHEEHENEERWLVSFADMMTLLFCLFMVLFAISSVNTSKFEALQRALQESFSGKILSGGKAVVESGASTPAEEAAPEPPLPALMPLQALNEDQGSSTQPESQAIREEESFQRLKRRIDELVRKEGLAGRVRTTIRRRGLVVELLTDKVFFDSGSAGLKPHAGRLLGKIGAVIRGERRHPVVVEGHTDSQPITGQYPSNWELSGARASSVVRTFAGAGVLERRLTVAGFGSQRPVATNSTEYGRSRNRRVDVVLTRIHTAPAQGGSRP